MIYIFLFVCFFLFILKKNKIIIVDDDLKMLCNVDMYDVHPYNHQYNMELNSIRTNSYNLIKERKKLKKQSKLINIIIILFQIFSKSI